MSTVGYATLQVIPSMAGIGSTIRGALTGELGREGERGGQAAADGVESKLGSRMKQIGAATAAILGVALAGGLAATLNTEQATDKLAAQLGATGQYAEDLGKIAGDLYAGAYGESLEQVNGALRGVLQNGLLPEDATDAQIQAITAKVLDLSTAFDQDLGGATQAVGQLMRTGLVDSADQALDLITRGMQQGADRSGDFLDTLTEYPALFQRLGLDGATSVGLIDQAMRAGARNSDLAADALKEFQIRATDASKTSSDAYATLGLNAEKMTAQIAAGGDGASRGLDTVLDRLRSMEDPVARNAAAVGLFGTQAEDLGEALFAMDPSAAVGALGQVEGAASRMGEELNGNAKTNITSFMRQAQVAFVDVIGGRVLPIVSTVASALATNFGPALQAVGGWLTGTVVPAIQDLATWMKANETPIMIVAGIVGTLLLPHLIRLGVVATVTKAQAVGMWIATQAASVTSSAVSVASTYRMIGAWIAARVAALASFGQTIAIMALYAAEAVASAARSAAAWVAAQARTVASLAVTAAGFVVQGAVMVASMAATAASVVAGWAVMGVQSLFRAGQMAAAWIVAMGPVGWITAAVIGLVALIIANWDTVVAWTRAAASAVVEAVKSAVDFLIGLFLNFTLVGLIIKHWDTIVAFTRSAFGAVVDAVSTGISNAVAFVTGLPGRILGALGDFGSLLFDKGRDLIQGLVNGIASAASFVGNIAKNIVNSIIDFVNTKIIGNLNSMLEFSIMGVTVNPPDIPGIPKLAEGGIVPATPGGVLAFIGEGGEDELVIPRSKARNILGGGGDQGGRPVELHVHTRQEVDVPTLARLVARELAWGTS